VFHPHQFHRDPDEDERRRIRVADDRDEETRLHELLDRAAERASLPFRHPSIHRLARTERARRIALSDRWAAA
jgi:hypothetical protein